ncbi:hypothetical protein BH20ACT3_BH20ACT3_18470 [soil metagenome]
MVQRVDWVLLHRDDIDATFLLGVVAGEVSLVEPETEPRTGDLARRAGHLTA